MLIKRHNDNNSNKYNNSNTQQTLQQITSTPCQNMQIFIALLGCYNCANMVMVSPEFTDAALTDTMQTLLSWSFTIKRLAKMRVGQNRVLSGINTFIV